MKFLKPSQDSFWILVLIFALAFILLSSISPILFHDSGFTWLSKQWMGNICHTNIDRALQINGQSTILCSRCMGIYSAFFFGLIVLPFVIIRLTKKTKVNLVYILIVLNAVDILGSVFNYWNNSILSRFILGALFGVSLSLLFTKNKS